MQTTIHILIEEYNRAGNEVDKQAIKNQIHLHYYQASAAERKSVWEIMQPFVKEIEMEMIEKDPIARQTYEMLKRSEASKAVLKH